MFKKYIALCMILILSITMVGCNGTTAEEKKEGTEKIKIGVSPYPAWYVWFIAQEEGIFEKYELDVELTYFPVYSDSLQAFNSGQLDMLNVATADTIAPFNKGVDFKVVLINDNSNGADGLVAKKKYNTLADLKGQKVATEYGTIEHFFLLKALDSVGLAENDVEFTNMTVNDSGTAMVAGVVEAASVWEPSLTIALKQSDNHLLYSSADTPGLIPDLVIASGALLETKREDVKNIMNAWYDSLAFYNENPDKALEHMAKYAEVSVDEMRNMMAGSKLFSIEDTITAMTEKQESYMYLPYTIRETAKFLVDVAMIDEVPANPEEMIDVSLIQEISEKRESFQVPDTKALAGK